MIRGPGERLSFGGGTQVLSFIIVSTIPRDLYTSTICVCMWTILGLSLDGKRCFLGNQYSQRNITLQLNSNV